MMFKVRTSYLSKGRHKHRSTSSVCVCVCLVHTCGLDFLNSQKFLRLLKLCPEESELTEGEKGDKEEELYSVNSRN